jgi:hypothetical protein
MLLPVIVLLLLKKPLSKTLHDPPPPSTVHANCVVRPYTDAQARCIVVAIALSSQRRALTLAPRGIAIGLDDQPCRATAVVFLLHELQLWAVPATAT